MDVGTFCAQSHVLVVAGKGGVGKTTMSAALARMAADAGKTVLIVELEGKSGITAAFGLDEDLGYEEMELAPAAAPGPAGRTGSVRARRLTSDDALMEYLEDHGLGACVEASGPLASLTWCPRPSRASATCSSWAR